MQDLDIRTIEELFSQQLRHLPINIHNIGGDRL